MTIFSEKFLPEFRGSRKGRTSGLGDGCRNPQRELIGKAVHIGIYKEEIPPRERKKQLLMI